MYQDQKPASPTPCTGDTADWGQNGVNITSPVNSVPITDPTLTATPSTFVSHRFRFFAAPGMTAAAAAAFEADARNPVQTSVAP